MDADTSAEIVRAWSTYYATLTAASATLSGLLFFSLTLNIEPLLRDDQRGLLIMGYQTLATFLIIVLYGLVFLMPDITIQIVGISLTFGSLSMLFLNRRLIGQVKMLDVQQHRYARTRMRLILVPTLIDFIVAILMIVAPHRGLLYVFASVLIIQLLTASYNAWWLLIRARGYTDPQGR